MKFPISSPAYTHAQPPQFSTSSTLHIPHYLCPSLSTSPTREVHLLQSVNQHWYIIISQVHKASPSFTISQSLLKLMSIESMMPSNHLTFCHPLFLLSSIYPSNRVISSELAIQNRWPKYWSFSISISPCNVYLGLISFTIDWFDLLAVQGTLNSLLQHHNLKASVLQCSAFFIVQLSHIHIWLLEKP